MRQSHFDSKTWQTLLGAVYKMNAADSHADFAAAVVAGLKRLIDAEVIVFQVFDRAAERILVRSSPRDAFTAEEVAYYTAHSDEMPLVAHYARIHDPHPRRMSDVVDDATWLTSEYYRRCLSRLVLPRCLALPIAVDATTVVGVSFNRGGADFSDRDCALLSAFGPHLLLAWQRHGYPWAEAAEIAAQRVFRALGLSPRESEVLFWMTEGKQNREIAMILGLSIATVQEHVANMLAKLQQENRHMATVFAINRLRDGRQAG